MVITSKQEQKHFYLLQLAISEQPEKLDEYCYKKLINKNLEPFFSVPETEFCKDIDIHVFISIIKSIDDKYMNIKDYLIYLSILNRNYIKILLEDEMITDRLLNSMNLCIDLPKYIIYKIYSKLDFTKMNPDLKYYVGKNIDEYLS